MYVEETEPPPPRMKNLTEVMSALVTRLKCTCSVQASIYAVYLYCTQYTVKIHLPSLLIEIIQSSNP